MKKKQQKKSNSEKKRGDVAEDAKSHTGKCLGV
jgi:hypothetical protein